MLQKLIEQTKQLLTHQDEPDDDYQKKLYFNEKLLYFKENGSKTMKEYTRIYRLLSKKNMKPNPILELLPEIWFYENDIIFSLCYLAPPQPTLSLIDVNHCIISIFDPKFTRSLITRLVLSPWRSA